MDQAIFLKTLSEIHDKVNKITVDVAILMTKSETKDGNCENHQKKMEDHYLRIRALELVASSAAGSSTTSHNWRDTLIQAFTMAATVAATVMAIRVT